MDFSVTPEQRRRVHDITSWAHATLGADTGRHEAEGTFDEQGWRDCAAYGVLGWLVPEQYGGSGLDPVSLAMAFEALGHGCRNDGLTFAINNHVFACMSYILDHGSDAQRQAWLPGLADGTLVGAHALSEPDVGSNVLALTTTATRVGGGYRINGHKTFISNGPRADVLVLFARTGDAGTAPQAALSAFVMDAHLPGITVADLPKAGVKSTLMGSIALEEVYIPATGLLGREGEGYTQFTRTMEWERGLMAAAQVGAMERVLDQCIRYANERHQFDRPIGEFESVSTRLANMRLRLEVARLMLYKLAWMKSTGKVAVLEASMLKVLASEGALETGLDALRIHGARGYVEEYGIAPYLRGVLAAPIYGGTNDIQRGIIARLSGAPS